jgi:hypothetical protein
MNERQLFFGLGMAQQKKKASCISYRVLLLNYYPAFAEAFYSL